MNNPTHEAFSRNDNVLSGSDRSFGIVMAAALVAAAVFDFWQAGRLWPWSSGMAALLLAMALIRPRILGPFNRLWLKFGLLLHRVVSPIVMAVLFFGTICPTGLALRAIGRDPLRLKQEPEAASYWIKRQPLGQPTESMRDQF